MDFFTLYIHAELGEEIDEEPHIFLYLNCQTDCRGSTEKSDEKMTLMGNFKSFKKFKF